MAGSQQLNQKTFGDPKQRCKETMKAERQRKNDKLK
jgi:hypothetical protein